MITVLSISAFLFVAYITAIIVLFGVPASISDSFYLLDRKKNGLGSLFTVWCFVTAFTVAAMMNEHSAVEWHKFTVPFTCFGLAFVGSAPYFNAINNRNIHFAGAAICAVFGLTWIILPGHWIIPLLLIPAATVIQAKFGNRLFWFEAAMFVSMYLTLFRIVVLKI